MEADFKIKLPKEQYNLYCVQHSDRPMHIVARDWHDAVKLWQKAIQFENPDIDWTDMEGEGKPDQPDGIQLVAENNDLLIPMNPFPSETDVDEITADHMADLYARAREEGENSKQKEIDDLRRRIKQMRQAGYPLIKGDNVKQIVTECTNWLMDQLGYSAYKDSSLAKQWYEPSERKVRVALTHVYEQAFTDCRKQMMTSDAENQCKKE